MGVNHLSHRPERLAEALKKEISDLVLHDIKDPGIGFITITGVEVTSDLSHAKIYASVLGNDEQKKATAQALKRATGYIRSELGKRIRLRHIPEIVFEMDTSIERGTKLIKLIEDVQSAEKDGIHE